MKADGHHMAAPGVALQPAPLEVSSPDERNDRGYRRRVDWLCLVALCFLTLLSWIPRWAGPIDLRWDGGTYFLLGTSMYEGKGYRLLNEPGAIRANQYPPLLPAIVAAHEMVLKSTDPVKVGLLLRKTWIAISIGYILGSFLLARLFMRPAYAFWLALICLMSYDMYYLGTLCFAELPFGLAAVLFAWLYLGGKPGSVRREVAAPAFAIAGYLLRSMGIALLAAWVLDSLLRKQFRSAAVRLAVSLVPILAWQTYVHAVESGSDYKRPYYAYQRDPALFYNVSYAVNMRLKDPFQPDLGNATGGELAKRFLINVAAIPSTLGQSVTAREGFFRSHTNLLNRSFGRTLIPHESYKLLLNLLGALVLLGLVRLLRLRQWLVSLTVLLTLLAVCTTPWPGQFARYLAALLPFLLIAVMALLRGVVGLPGSKRESEARQEKESNRVRLLRFAAAGLILGEASVALASGNKNFLNTAFYQAPEGSKKQYHVLHYSMAYPDSEEALHWLAQRTGREAVIADSMPQWTYIVSGFKAVMPPLTTSPAKAQQLIDTVPVSYVLIEELLMDDNFNTFFPNLVKGHPENWKLVYSSQDGLVQLYGRVGVAKLSGSVLKN